MQGTVSKMTRLARADTDVVLLGIAIAAILMFVGTGGSVGPEVVNHWLGRGPEPDLLLVNALLINIALIIFGWRRYSELTLEVTERRKAEEQARLLAETDPLTNCLNRRSIGPAFAQLVEKAQKSSRGVAVMVLDLDGFKLVNDLNGHGIGDAVLKETAKRIRAVIEHDGIVARLGGDEFACVICCDSRNPDRIDDIATRLIEIISEPMQVNNATFEITVSIGID